MSPLHRSITLSVLLLLAMVGSFVVVADEQNPTDEKSKTLSLWQPGDPGQRLIIDGRVISADGRPVEGAAMYIRQADGNGVYSDNYQSQLTTIKDGRYAFRTVLPGQQSEAKHIHITVSHTDFQATSTEILFKGDPHLDPATDRDIAIFLEEAGTEGEPVLLGRFEIVLQPL